MSLVAFTHKVAMRPPPNNRSISSVARHLVFFLSLLLFVLLLAIFMLILSFAPIFFTINSHTSARNVLTSGEVSPLYSLLSNHEQKLDESEVDAELMVRINTASSLETKSFVIAETVVPVDKIDALVVFVGEQIQNKSASDVVSSAQLLAILKMVELSPKSSGILKEEIGQEGSLRCSAVLALMKEHDQNLHFFMLGLKMEPHLGWNWITASERNSWNIAVARLLRSKLMKQARSYLTIVDEINIMDNLHQVEFMSDSSFRLA